MTRWPAFSLQTTATGYTPLPIGMDTGLSPGQKVIAVGSPMGWIGP